jgi:uncharacterized protein (DUF1810 family)
VSAAAAPFDLERFVAAQAPVIDAVRAELRAGAKRTHWMWFVFPQLAVLGRSQTARHYGIASLAEAQAYWAHPVLGPRLAECAALLAPHAARGAVAVLGEIDALKLRSCLTLFERAAPDAPVFPRLLALYYRSERCPLTLRALGA